MELEFASYVRKPFKVEAILITEDNLDEIAKDVGTLNESRDGSRYIDVDRRLVPNVLKVYPGFWMTKVRKQVRCYPGNLFEILFVELSDELDEFLTKLDATDDKPTGFPHEGEILGAEENAG